MTTDNNDSIDVDELIAKVAKQHNILLSKDDPILVTVLLNDLILKEYVSTVKSNSTSLKEDLNKIFLAQKDEYKNIAKMIIEESKNATQEAITEAAIKSSSLLKSEIQKSISLFNLRNQQFSEEITKSKRIAFLSACVALLSMLATIIVIFI